jgi:hypothetical protein
VLVVAFSLLITFYLIIPESIFRTVFGWFIPARSFVLTKTETAYKAIVVAFLPFVFALAGTWYFPIMQSFPFPVHGNKDELRRSDYKIVTVGLYSDAQFEKVRSEFWPAFTRSTRRQGRIILWYFVAVAFEAVIAGKLAKNYARYRENQVLQRLGYRWLADKVLFSYISEWHPLLTPYLYVDPDTTVQADILCTNDTLYQGTVSQYFVKDGQLSGIFLRGPRRFDREGYLKEKEAGKKPEAKNFWKPIPSENLYFFVDKIVNMNLSYKSASKGVADMAAITRMIAELLGKTIDLKKVTITQEQEKKP